MNICISSPIEIENGGLFISNGKGTHPKRVINSFELIFICQGKLAIQEGEIDYHLNTGDVLILHPNIEHKGLQPYSDNLKFYWVHFTMPIINGDYTNNKNNEQSIDLIKTSTVEDMTKISTLFNLLLHEQESGMDKTSLNLLLLLLLRELTLKHDTNKNTKPASLAHHAEAIIRRYHREPITPSDIAQKLQCNVDYLGRVFKQTFGHTLTESIHQRKINTAKRELVELNHSIGEVSDKLGFSDVSYFRRVFFKYVGMTPSAYRKSFSIHSVNTE